MEFQTASLAVSVAWALHPQIAFLSISKGWGLTRAKEWMSFQGEKFLGEGGL